MPPTRLATAALAACASASAGAAHDMPPAAAEALTPTRPPLPGWAPTYSMPLSTAIMPCNYSGMFSAELAGKWGLADFDWCAAASTPCC